MTIEEAEKRMLLMESDGLEALFDLGLTARAFNGLRLAGFDNTYGLYTLRKRVGNKAFNKIMKMLPSIGVSSIALIGDSLDKWEQDNKEVLA